MSRILPDIRTLVQYISLQERHPEACRPERCPTCGRCHFWRHGCYSRKPDRGSGKLNPITIYRFICCFCGKTCSVLPECIPPRRWYQWMVQSVVIWLFLFGRSGRQIAGALSMSRSTVSRWLKGFERATPVVAFHWCSLCPELGRHACRIQFWTALLRRYRLGQVMRILHEMGVWIPCSDRKLASWDGLQEAFR